MTIIEKWRRLADGSSQAGAFQTDLSKAFDCIDHDLLTTKLYANIFDKHFLYFINSYFQERKQRTKIHYSYSTFAEILVH